jgi:tetratricopeptide (TPR) repeat protein
LFEWGEILFCLIVNNMHPILLAILVCIAVVVASTIFPGFTSQIVVIAALLVWHYSQKYKNETSEAITKAYHRGITHYDEGNYDQAIRYFTLILYETLPIPNDCQYIALSYQARAGCHFCLKDFNSAIKDYSQAIQLDPINSNYFAARGIAHTGMNEYAKAIDDLSMAIKLKPDNANAFSYRGFAYFCINEYTEAINDYNQAIVLNPGDANSFCSRAKLYAYNNQDIEAANDYNRAIRLDSGCIDAYMGRGFVYFYGVKYALAIQDFTIAIQLDANNSTAHEYRGMANCYIGGNQKSIDDFSEAARLQPSANKYYNLALTQHLFGLIDESLSSVNQVLTLDVNFTIAYYLRSNILYQLNDSQGANDNFQQAMKVGDSQNEIDSGDAHSFYHRGLAKYRMGDHEGAISDIEMAMQICLNIQYFTFHQQLLQALLDIKKSHQE